MSKYLILLGLIATGLLSAVVRADTADLTCVTSSQPPLIRAEGLSERLGDIVLSCSGGTPNTPVSLDLSVFLTVNVTNRINTTNQAAGVMLTTDTGSGPVATVPAILVASNVVTFNGVQVPVSATGTVQIRISGLRGNATQYVPGSPFVSADLSVGGAAMLNLTSSMLVVGQVSTGLYSTVSGATACDQHGSAGPANLSFAAFLAAGTIFDETRVTEGFAYALVPKSDIQSTGADTGTRILIQYSGAPPGMVLYVPQVVAGSDATKATSGGNFGIAASGGQYTPGGNGQLLLSFVAGADSTGAGGSPVYAPGASGSGTVSLDRLEAVNLTNGAGYAVYEVVDANDAQQEHAQIPTFFTFPPIYNGQTYDVTEAASLGPVSTVFQASQTAPIPRFNGMVAPSDCPVMGDCTAPSEPTIRTVTSSANFTSGTVVAGSFATIMGGNLKGNQVMITFDGMPAAVSYKGLQQINLIVPDAVAGKGSTEMIVSVDGQTASQAVPLMAFSPGVFPGAILNQDMTVNSVKTPAKRGSVIQIWGTGIAPNGVVTALVGGRSISSPEWWGPAPGIPGAQQVNLLIPSDLQFTGSTVDFSICEASPAAPTAKVCSPAQSLNIAQ